MTTYTWQECYSQSEALDLTEGVSIVKILTGGELDKGDLGWLLGDGRRVEFHYGRGGGCETCGWGGDETMWFVGTPNE